VQKAHRAFVVAPYRARPDGTLEPDIPTEGICAAQDRRPCKLNVDHRRERSTGPCFALTVMRCRSHKRGFTLYPPGHVPYGRIAVAPVASDASPIRDEDGAERYRGTLFEACLDAARRKPWHREHDGSTSRWWGTQLRRLTLAAQLLAVAPGVSSRRREQAAEILCVDLLLLHEQARKMRKAQGYHHRGTAIRQVLDAMPYTSFLPERLLECGHLGGLWGAPHRWLPDSAALHRRAFRVAGTKRPHRSP